MPVAEKYKSNMCSEGSHILQLVEVKEDVVASKFSASGKAPIWYWMFNSKTVNENTGEPEEVRHMTDAGLSPDNSQMKFWKKLIPGCNYETLDPDTDPLIGKWFSAEIIHENKGDKTYANIGFIKPYVRSTAPPKAAAKTIAEPTDGELEAEDPFAGE